jgi:VWFA-related protein
VRTISQFVIALSAGAMLVSVALSQSSNSNPPAISVTTRLITVDVVATNSHGISISDLKASDFQVFDNRSGPQKIARFQYIDRSSKPGSAPVGAPSSEEAATYSNQTFTRLEVPPTILLIDALNIDFGNHNEAHRQALMLLHQLPVDTPVAVFLLTHSLSVVQTFTTDPALLNKAVDRAFATSLPKITNPENDPDSVANKVQGGIVGQRLGQSEKRNYADQLTIIADQFADAMSAIAKYLSGYPGRKNLVWFSEAFPLWIEPHADFGGHPDTSYTRETFSGSASFANQVHSAAEALTDARVSIYPVDARGLEVSGLNTAAQDPPAMTSSNPRDAPNAGPLMAAQLEREDTERIYAQNTMEKMAEDTGGVPCRNTNDLSGCVAAALRADSSYYEISYYPDNVRWDGSFHDITVKVAAHGVKLRFRRGYFATDTATLAKQSANLLKQACASVLPAPSIPLTAQALSSLKDSEQSSQTRYLLTISLAGLSPMPSVGSNAIKLHTAVCEYDPKGQTFRIYSRNVTQTMPGKAERDVQAQGIQNVIVFTPKSETQRLRIAVLDPTSGLAGAIDVPAHPHEFVAVPGVSALDVSSKPAGGTGTALLFTHLAFHLPSGESSSLDSSGNALAYRGDIEIDQVVPAFFQATYGNRFHCQSGSLLPDAPASAVSAPLRFAFRSPSGLMVVIDLTGDQPAYSGALPVDSSARRFFDRLWKLCHCQRP